MNPWNVGDWCWHTRHATPCRIISNQELWGEITYQIWLPGKESVVHARPEDLSSLATVHATVNQILHAAASAKLLEALADNLLLAPIQSRVVALPHQLHALNRALSKDRIRYLLADEVGLGKTIEAGLILRELKLRGMVQRILVVTPKGLIRQWQAEMRLHFGEEFRFIEPSELAAFRQWQRDEESLWRMHDQVLCSLDSVKPLERRRGWSQEQLSTYNQERFEDLISAGWDLVIIDESHRLGGSTEQVARYKLGAALAEASPYLLLLSATPHQGKSDQFLRLMQLLDREAFPDVGSINHERVCPFVIRTEKRAAINAAGLPLFKPRVTRLHAVAWLPRHAAQQQLYEAVTDYVRHGYNQAMATKQRHIGFLMILMQRLVTSSTSAIRTTLEKRQALLAGPTSQAPLLELDDLAEWSELDGQSQLDMALQADGWAQEKAEVELLLTLARETERQGTDAKAEALLELIYKLQQEEHDQQLKILIFTEFVPTQSMLAHFLENRGFSVVLLNGSMDLDARTRAQHAFSQDVRVLLSTDAGGEGLNLQFCHVIVNFDIPWNPMRLEQRIGRVDRIGQSQVVRAFNFILEETVEYRVWQVLEEKLAVIALEFGVDKAADVMDSVEVEPIFDELFVHGLQHPESIDQDCAAALEQLREKVAGSRNATELLTEEHALEADEARNWRDHPAHYWLERAITAGLPARGGEAAKTGDFWKIIWGDGSESPRACFDACTSEAYPDIEWITLEEPRTRAVINALPQFVTGQPCPVLTLSGLPATVRGVWSLWQIRLSTDGFQRKRFLPVFLTDDDRTFLSTAKRIWDLLLTEQVECATSGEPDQASLWFQKSLRAAEREGERLYFEMKEQHRVWVAEERERLRYAFEARFRALEKVGLLNVREYRRRRLDAEQQERTAALVKAELCIPELNAVLMLRVGQREEVTL